VKTKLCALAVVALMAWGLKRHYADAHVDDLWWILAPTTQIVSVVTGTEFVAVSGEGYFSSERLFRIEKSCAGLNFMIAAFGMLAFTLLHRVRSVRSGVGVLGVSLLASYVAAILINATRITIAMWLAGRPLSVSSLSAADLHRLEGIVVYFGGLVLLHALARRIDRGDDFHRGDLALPLAAYYGITLVVPFVNGASQTGEAFVAHAVIVLVVPLVLMLLLSGVQRLVSAYRRRKVSAGSSAHARRTGSHVASAATTTIAPAPNT
jgi:exosortase K